MRKRKPRAASALLPSARPIAASGSSPTNRKWPAVCLAAVGYFSDRVKVKPAVVAAHNVRKRIPVAVQDRGNAFRIVHGTFPSAYSCTVQPRAHAKSEKIRLHGP